MPYFRTLREALHFNYLCIAVCFLLMEIASTVPITMISRPIRKKLYIFDAVLGIAFPRLESDSGALTLSRVVFSATSNTAKVLKCGVFTSTFPSLYTAPLTNSHFFVVSL